MHSGSQPAELCHLSSQLGPGRQSPVGQSSAALKLAGRGAQVNVMSHVPPWDLNVELAHVRSLLSGVTVTRAQAWPAPSFKLTSHGTATVAGVRRRRAWPAACRRCVLSRAWGALGSALGAEPSPPQTKHQTFPPKTCSEFPEVTFHFRSCIFSAHVDKTSASRTTHCVWVCGHGGPRGTLGSSTAKVAPTLQAKPTDPLLSSIHPLCISEQLLKLFEYEQSEQSQRVKAANCPKP